MSRVHVITHTYNAIEVPFLLDNKTGKMVPCHERIERNRRVTDYLEHSGMVVFTYVDQVVELENSLKRVHGAAYIEFLKRTSTQLDKDEYVLNHRFVPS